MGYLAEHAQPIYARDLERRFSLRHPTVSGILQRLEAGGMITCTQEAADHRRKRICLTQAGWESFRRAEQALNEVELAVTAGFTEAQHAQFCALLDLAIASLDDIRQGKQREEEPD